MKVDLNCDMGESFGLYQVGQDEQMMKYITSANIACGYHAGDPHVMRKTVELAKQYEVAIGAHPGFPDLIGFGRRRMNCTVSEVKDYIVYQLGALREFASISGLQIQHCKPHGALYMAAMEDKQIARAVLEAVTGINPDMIVFALQHSAVTRLGNEMGIRIAQEAYADCEHTKSGSIVPIRTRATAGNYEDQAERVLRMIKERKVRTDTGEDMEIQVQTVCIHGDTTGAPKLLEQTYYTLMDNNIEITAIGHILA